MDNLIMILSNVINKWEMYEESYAQSMHLKADWETAIQSIVTAKYHISSKIQITGRITFQWLPSPDFYVSVRIFYGDGLYGKSL